MREIIFKDSGPKLVFSANGKLKQLRTGTDSFAEHNDACEILARKICAERPASRAVADMYRIAKGELVEFVMLPVGADGTIEAVLGVIQPGGHVFTPSIKRPVDDPSVLSSLKNYHGDVAASLAWGNFAIRVRSVDNVKALAHFYAAVVVGDVAIVPNTTSHYNSHGVVLVDVAALSAEERQMLETDPDLYLKTSFATQRTATKSIK